MSSKNNFAKIKPIKKYKHQSEVWAFSNYYLNKYQITNEQLKQEVIKLLKFLKTIFILLISFWVLVWIAVITILIVFGLSSQLGFDQNQSRQIAIALISCFLVLILTEGFNLAIKNKTSKNEIFAFCFDQTIYIQKGWFAWVFNYKVIRTNLIQIYIKS